MVGIVNESYVSLSYPVFFIHIPFGLNSGEVLTAQLGVLYSGVSNFPASPSFLPSNRT